MSIKPLVSFKIWVMKLTNAYICVKKRVKNYKHIFFDLDRTLWDFNSNSREALTDIFKKLKLEQYFSSTEQFISLYHKNNENLFEAYRHGKIKKAALRSLRFALTLKDVKIDNPELVRNIGDLYINLSTEKTILFPFAIEILDYLFPNYSLYILTNGFKETQFNKLKNSGLSSYFSKVFTSEAVGFSKPHPNIFQLAINSVNARKNECLMIGDDFEVDILGAKSFGIDQVFFNPDNLIFENKASYEIRSLIELKNIL
jgi:putative hydrolase of the HAD superfamily